MRATACGKEAWSINHEPMDKNQIEGAADQGERANDREAFVIQGSGGVNLAVVCASGEVISLRAEILKTIVSTSTQVDT